MSEIEQDILNVRVTVEQVSSSLSCSVCCEDFVLDESVLKLPCRHLFHSPCISTWLDLRTTCPVCRSQVREETPREEVTATTATLEEMDLLSDGEDLEESYELDMFTDEEQEGEIFDEFISEDEGVSEEDIDDLSLEEEDDLGAGVVASTPVTVCFNTDIDDDEEGDEEGELEESFDVDFETDISFEIGDSTTITCSANSVLMSTLSDSSISMDFD